MQMTNRTMIDRLSYLQSLAGFNVAGKLGYGVARNTFKLEEALKAFNKVTTLSAEETERIATVMPEIATTAVSFTTIKNKLDKLPEFADIITKLKDRETLLEESVDVDVHMVAEEAVENYPLNIVVPLGWMMK